MKVITDILRLSDSYLHRAWRKIQHYELEDAEILLDMVLESIREVKKEVRRERKK